MKESIHYWHKIVWLIWISLNAICSTKCSARLSKDLTTKFSEVFSTAIIAWIILTKYFHMLLINLLVCIWEIFCHSSWSAYANSATGDTLVCAQWIKIYHKYFIDGISEVVASHRKWCYTADITQLYMLYQAGYWYSLRHELSWPTFNCYNTEM